MTPRALDDDGHRWPITGTTCSVCTMPTLFDEEAHPLCRDPFTPEERANAEALPDAVTDRWLISGQPVTTAPVTTAVTADGRRACTYCSEPLPETAGPGVVCHVRCWANRGRKP